MELITQLAQDQVTAVCDKAPGALRALLTLLRPQAAAIRCLGQGVHDLLLTLLVAGPRDGGDAIAWPGRVWQCMDIAVETPAIGVQTVVNAVFDAIQQGELSGLVVDYILDLLLHLVPRHHVQPSGAVPLDPCVNWALKLLQQGAGCHPVEIKENATDLIVAVSKLVTKRIDPFMKKLKEPLRSRLLDTMAVHHEEAKAQGHRSRRSSVSSARSRRSSVTAAAHFIETGIRLEPEAMAVGKMDVGMFSKGTKKRRGKEEEVSDFLSRLTHLVLKNKGIREIENLHHCKRIQVLYLYDNRIERLAGLEVLSRSLTQLYLQNNAITKMEGLHCLPKLTKLYLDGNSIQRLEGLEENFYLEELHLSNQKLPRGASLSFDAASTEVLSQSLATFTCANNNVVDPLPLCHLQSLTALDLRGNGVTDMQVLLSLASCCGNIMTLDVAGNPAAKFPKARETLITVTDHLNTLDGKDVKPKERDFLRHMHQRRAAGGSRRNSMQLSQQEQPLGMKGNRF